MPKFNVLTGKYELTPEEKTKMAKKNLRVEVDRFNPDTWPVDGTAVTRKYDGVLPPLPRPIEAQHEGEQEVVLRQAPQPVPQPTIKPEWKIEGLGKLKNAFTVKALDAVSDKRIEFMLEAYYDNTLVSRSDVQAVTGLLLKTFADKGVPVAVPNVPGKPDLMEEMYQLLSIIMEDDHGTKYGSQWGTIRQMYDSLIQ